MSTTPYLCSKYYLDKLQGLSSWHEVCVLVLKYYYYNPKDRLGQLGDGALRVLMVNSQEERSLNANR